MPDFEAVRQRLLQTDEQYRRLAEEHRELDRRLHELASKHVSEPEQLEVVTLKKKKLQLKDRMEDIVRGSLNLTSSPPASPAAASPASTQR